MLSLKEITKEYVTGDSKVSALKGVNIEFRESEFVSILGPSGCGKTTLLNIIGGLDRYTNGDLNINGKSTKDFKDCDWDSYRNHSIGFIFQSYNLIPHQTVLSNVELALTLSGVSKIERKKRAIKALEEVGLGDQIHKKPNQMSGGQMQRVAIARALVNDPDIILADEPTGALDTDTSVSIMELLKSISKDKLIVMVTHNPELAMEYSSRIIRLLDGRVIDDSAPFEENVVEPIKKAQSEISKADKGNIKKERKKLKTSMNFLTALSLSKNNLLTKKARTFLTSFAGSIGIIGIALILSLSNGVQLYIDQVQSDTLSSYPLQIAQTTTSIGDIMESMAGSQSEEVDHDMTKVYSQNQMGEMINTLMEETKVNNLEKFKDFLDNNEEIQKLTTDIQYGYQTTLNVFKTDTSDGVVQVNPSTLLTDTGMYSDDQLGAMSSMGMAQTNVFTQMIDNDELIESQYKVLSGKLPEKYDEVVLVVDKNNEINDYVLYSLGLLDPSELQGLMTKAMKGEEIKIDSKQQVYTYEELLSLEFKVVPSISFYDKEDGVWIDKSDDLEFMKNVVENGTDLKIVGIVKPSEDATANSISGAIGYRHDLTTYLMGEVEESEIIKEQLADPETDIFTGLKFETANNANSSEADTSSQSDSSSADSNADSQLDSNTDSQSDSSTDSNSQSAVMTDEEISALKKQYGAEDISNEEFLQMMQATQQSDSSSTAGVEGSAMGNFDMSAMTQSTDMSQMSDTQKQFMASLTEEQMTLMQKMMTESSEIYQAQMSGATSQSSYDENLKKLGYAVKSNPSSINIYPVDFEAKEKIVDIINDYNENNSESDTIEYTDYVGLMMSSVTTIINSISYILIAFVAISLVVSSIMIGIITYISVLERTKEIGILRSIGASKKDISRVFNAETVIVGFVAGFLGILISYLLTIPINLIISKVTDVPLRATIPYVGAIVLIAISVVLTLIAGLFPAKIAAKKDPVIALRTE